MKSKALVSALAFLSAVSAYAAEPVSTAPADSPALSALDSASVSPLTSAPRAISCSDGSKVGVYPCRSTGGIYLDLEKGGFSFSTHSEADALKFEWENSEATKDSSGALKVIGIVTGKVGVVNDDGEGAICQGEEKTNAYANPKMMEKGKFSIDRVRAQAYQRAVDECHAEKGTLVMDGDSVAIVHAHSQVAEPINKKSRTPSAAKPKKCFSSEVQIKCDLSAHASAMSDLYRKFRAEYPANPVANDYVFDALR